MKFLSRTRPVLVAAALLPFFVSCTPKEPSGPDAKIPIVHPAAKEISGLAASHRSWDLLWVHNDSGNPPVLYALTTTGVPAGSLRVTGIKNTDWEDIASFELDGKAWLLVADTGDNAGNRKSYTLLVLEEPSPSELSIANETSAPVAWKVPFTYPDGPHDCEAAAVDVREEKIYLITKRSKPPKVYSVPLRPRADGSVAIAENVASLVDIPQPSTAQRILPTPTGRYRAQVTGMDISPDLKSAAVLTYGNVLLYQRRSGESWSTAFSKTPIILPPHGLPQAEAIGFSRDGRSLYVTSERTSPLMLRYPMRAEKAE